MKAINLNDFVDIKECKVDLDVNSFINICKRFNNTKRGFLFVNKYQGKHIPISPSKMEYLYQAFYNEIRKYLFKNERILVVGFAETATALAESICYSMIRDEEITSKFVYYLQTTRENVSLEQHKRVRRLINFKEEHSHAVDQSLYCNWIIPDFDRILFIEDEITTGNTILNFIRGFKERYPLCKYSVASILNWQNDYYSLKYINSGIETICLVRGTLKEGINIFGGSNFSCKEPENYFYVESNSLFNTVYLNLDIGNPRIGVGEQYFKDIDNVISSFSNSEAYSFVKPKDKVMVIGTEEYMYVPYKIANYIESHFGAKVYYRATTRSPISVVEDDNYIIKDSFKVCSAYDDERVTYLYNMNGDYNKIIVITDAFLRGRFPISMVEYANRNNKRILFIEVD